MNKEIVVYLFHLCSGIRTSKQPEYWRSLRQKIDHGELTVQIHDTALKKGGKELAKAALKR